MANPKGTPKNLKPNRGGNEGNVYGAGRKPNAVVQRCLEGFDENIDWLRSVAKNEQVIEVANALGIVQTRKPTYAERLAAIDRLAKYGVPNKLDVNLSNVEADTLLEALKKTS